VEERFFYFFIFSPPHRSRSPSCIRIRYLLCVHTKTFIMNSHHAGELCTRQIFTRLYRVKRFMRMGHGGDDDGKINVFPYGNDNNNNGHQVLLHSIKPLVLRLVR
jgi:hypothetical protein